MVNINVKSVKNREVETMDQHSQLNIEKIITDILGTVEREREREIISRRFGLKERRETLEQIGELLGITRERVRQLEKAVLAKLKATAGRDLPHIKDVEAVLTDHLKSMGGAARTTNLAKRVTGSDERLDQARVSFLALLSPRITTIDENDFYFQAAGLTSLHDEKALQAGVDKIVDAIKKIGEPTTIEAIAEAVKSKDVKHVKALATISKQVATLHKRWGLVKWPMVNPKNIRDKIYVILHDSGKPMHFNEIAKAIKDSSFKRKDVTTQAIHNELIKDKRFVLIGRGIYALKEWGYDKGTVADVIAKVLKKAGEPLHRDEIVKRVLKSRQVKETTILLNLQGKAQFKRVAKATYTLAE